MGTGQANPGRIKVAAGQMDPKMRDKAANLDLMERWIRQAAAEGAKLVVFPECALSGYGYTSMAEALEDAETVPGPASERLGQIAAETGTYVVFGLVERIGDRIFNAAAFLGPEGLIGTYHKSHLPYEALDRFVEPGDALPVFDTPIGRIGVLICFDLRFPEPARVMALAGADLIVQPTNLPRGGEMQPEFLFQTRAAENRVWIVSADRVGVERGARYIGRSAIVDPTGQKLAEADGSSETLIVAEIEPAKAREKDLILIPGAHELYLFRRRRPELYGTLLSHPAGVEPAAAGR